ncbi:MAG TPA: hypothetical protein VFP34_16630 [Microlunatus sp.]|nr:hypothetical protein [Microlunatus sp.]
MAAFDVLMDDAALVPRTAGIPAADAATVVANHRAHRAASWAAVVASLVVPDRALAEVGRAAGDDPVAVSVVNTGGAGGLVALAGRSVSGVEVVAVESALRDLDDLAGNAARVVSAAGELGDQVSVFVELPQAYGWVRAVEHVEAAGLFGQLRTGGSEPEDVPTAERLAEQLSVLVEADLPFRAAGGLRHAWPTLDHGRVVEHGFVSVVIALAALVDGAAVEEAAELLRLADRHRLVAAVGGWDEATGSRVRRRLRRLAAPDLGGAVEELELLGLSGLL